MNTYNDEAGVHYKKLINNKFIIMESKLQQQAQDLIEEANGKNPSFTQAEYAHFANLIEAATNGAGTNTEIIYTVFGKLNNNADVLELIKVYGKRPNNWFGISLGHFTLSKLLISELSSSERGKINSTLAGKGITISF